MAEWQTDGNPDGDIGPNSFLGTRANDPLRIRTRSSVNNTDVITITPAPDATTTGNVGIGPIGATGPQAKLHISSNDPPLRLDSAGPRATVQMVKGGGPLNSGWDFGVGRGTGDNDFWFGDFSLYRLILEKGTGNVHLGDAPPTPRQKLSLQSGNVLLPNALAGTDGNLYFGGRTDTGELGMRLFGGRVNPGPGEIHAGFIDVKTDTTTDGLIIRVDTGVGGSERMRVTANGIVGIGTRTPSPSFRLDVAGAAHASSFPTSSDARLKTNVKQLTNVLDKLEKIRAVSFQWNELCESLGRSTGRTEIGVIGQEVEAVFPELVTAWGDESYEAVDYGRLTGILIEAVKELKAQNEALRSRIEALERTQQ